MGKLILTIAIAVCWSLSAAGQVIRIGLYHDRVVRSAVVYCASGRYAVLGDGEELARMGQGEIFYISHSDGKLMAEGTNVQFGPFSSFELKPLELMSAFRIRPVSPVAASRTFDDGLLLLANDRFMTLVNMVDTDKYLAGVVESESGPNARPEYYKAQALLARTYAMKNLDKHQNEGFSLCDGVHCQAYKGKSVYNPEILKAVFETTGLIVADQNYRLITAVFHSNSGGETQRGADVWISGEPYLQAVIDPYSIGQPNSRWQDTISFRQWKAYLVNNGMRSVGKLPDELLFVEQMHRKKYFILDKDSLLMTKIRDDWHLKSAFFNMFPEGDRVIIMGKGYGHGIGMSQEGAMRMAVEGYSYTDIINFYFFDVKIMDYGELPRSERKEVSF
ncbi:MAG: SpoIID/LytB domain-containing protein [Bacteroidota bacterium]